MLLLSFLPPDCYTGAVFATDVSGLRTWPASPTFPHAGVGTPDAESGGRRARDHFRLCTPCASTSVLSRPYLHAASSQFSYSYSFLRSPLKCCIAGGGLCSQPERLTIPVFQGPCHDVSGLSTWPVLQARICRAKFSRCLWPNGWGRGQSEAVLLGTDGCWPGGALEAVRL